MREVLQLTEDDLNDKEVLGRKLMTLAEIVVRKHFYASLDCKEDLVSVGVLKAITLINKGQWNKGKGSFVNYIYSGMRNDIHNYLYHQNKFSFVDNESLPDGGRDDIYFEEECDIEYSLIHSVCNKFIKSFGEFIEDRVIYELEEMGYIVRGMRQNPYTVVHYNYLADKYGEEVESDIIGRIIGLVLWKKKDMRV